jgi:hypothetical protein
MGFLQVTSNFAQHMTTIQGNISVLEKRIAELSQKIEELGLETF